MRIGLLGGRRANTIAEEHHDGPGQVPRRPLWRHELGTRTIPNGRQPMISALFLSTFILSALALGGAAFILVTFLPSILPGATAEHRRGQDRLVKRIQELNPSDAKDLGKRIDGIQQENLRLEQLQTGIRQVLSFGFFSSVLFLLAGISGLWVFFQSPSAEVVGVEYVLAEGAMSTVVGVAFAAGVASMMVFLILVARITLANAAATSPDLMAATEDGLIGKK